MLYQYNDTVSWTKGPHSFKFGVNVFAPMRNIFQDEPGTRGDLYFSGVFSGLGNPSGHHRLCRRIIWRALLYPADQCILRRPAALDGGGLCRKTTGR